MSFKFSAKIKEVFDYIRALSSFLTVIGIAIVLFFLFKPENFKWEDLGIPYLPLILKLIAIGLVLSPLAIYFFNDIKLRLIILRGNLSGYIIEKHELVIDIYDPEGKSATFYQKLLFHKFSRKTRKQYLSKLSVSGTVAADSIQSLNCFYSLNKEQNVLSISYVNNMKRLNKIPNAFRENDKFIMLYAVLKDTFTSDKENWDIDVTHLCQDYNLQIILPPGKTCKCAKFLRVNEKEEVVDDIQPLTIREGDRQKIVLQVMNFDKHEKFKVRWELN